jgi:hypothetical protein
MWVMTRAAAVGYFLSPLRSSGQNVGRGDGGAERTSRLVANFFEGIDTAQWTCWNLPVFVQPDIGCQVVRKVDSLAIGLALFQSELLGSSIKLEQIADASRVINTRRNKIGNYNSHHQSRAEANSHDPQNNNSLGRNFFLRFTHSIKRTPLRQFRCGVYALEFTL